MAFATAVFSADPATAPRASTKGTPALAAVESVREHRATAALTTMAPTIGVLNSAASVALRKRSERRRSATNAPAPPAAPSTAASHQSRSRSDAPMTNRVNAGSSASAVANTASNCGTMWMSRRAVTVSAARSTTTG